MLVNNETRKHPVYLLTYDHGGYILWGTDHFEERLQSAYDWLDKYPAFKIGLDNECFAYDIYSQIAPGIISNIQNALKKYKNRFAIGSSTYGQPLSMYISEESNVRQLTYAVNTNKKHFHTVPPVFAISEHALHSQIPQLIVQAGYKGAIMRTHFMMYGYNPTYNSPFGWWEGPDGTRIRTVPTYEGQGNQFGLTTFDNWILTRWPDATDRSLEDFAEKFAGIEPLLGSRLDDAGLRCEKLAAHVQQNPEKYRFILLEEMLDLYDENPKDVYAAAPNDFVTRMPWGYCGNEIWNACRRSETNTVTAEKANALAVLEGGADNTALLEESWKQLLIAQHHDVQICGLVSDARGFLGKSLESSEKVLKESMRCLSGKVSYDAESIYINVFNPNSWTCENTVTARIKIPRYMAKMVKCKSFYAVCGDEKIPCDLEILESTSNRNEFVRRANIKFRAKAGALTFKSYKIEGVEETFKPEITFDKESQVIESKYYSIKLDKNGIVRMTDKISGKVIAGSESGSLFTGVIDGIPCRSTGKWKVHAEGKGAKAIYWGDIGGIILIFTLGIRNDTKLLDCSVRFTHNGERIGNDIEEEAFLGAKSCFMHRDKLCFALKPSITEKPGRPVTKVRDMPFMVSETEADNACIQGNYWTAISNGTDGLAVFNKGAMCSVYENGELLIPLAYANKYIWGERYLFGDYTHEFALLPFTGFWQEADIHRKALEYAYPFVVDVINTVKAQHSAGNTIAPVECNFCRNAVLSALYSENGALYARLYEYEGKKAAGTLRITGNGLKKMSLTECNLLGETVSHNANNADTDIVLHKYQIKTLRSLFV